MKVFLAFTLFISQFFIVLAQNWLPCGNGTNNGYNGGITLQSYNGKLIAGGAFNVAGNVNAQGVAMWDGSDWSIVDSTMNNFFAVRPLVIFRGQLYGFVSSFLSPPGFMIRLDSSFKWHIVPNSNFSRNASTGYINSAAVFQDELYVGGYFDSIGNTAANHVAKWDGVNWTPVGTGIDNDDIFSMAVYGNELYAGGNFHNAGGVIAHHLARWNGNHWSDVGGGTDARVFALQVYNSELYVGGYFQNAGGQPIQHLARWNTVSFMQVGGGFGFAGAADAMAVYGNRLVLGGYFGSGAFQNQAGTWDGANFAGLGTGLNAGPTDFEIYNGHLFAGGRFHDIGHPNGVAMLDTAEFTVRVPEVDLPNHSISIYPNPFASQTTISFEKDQKNTTIGILDVMGRQVWSSRFSGRQFVIDREGIEAGIYFVKITNAMSQVAIRKIVIQ